MNPIAEFVKENRKAAGLTQEQFALRSGLGLRFLFLILPTQYNHL